MRKQKLFCKIVVWILCISMMFETAGMPVLASELGDQTASLLTQEELDVEEEEVKESMSLEDSVISVSENETIENEESEKETEEEAKESEESSENINDKEVLEETLEEDTLQEESSFEVNYMIYEVLSESEKTVKLTGVNRTDFYNNYKSHFSAPEIVIPFTISNEGITYQVVEIGEFAFADYTYEEYQRPYQGYDSYVDNLYVKKITLSEGIKKIGKAAFYRMYQLEEVVLPDSLEEIGEAAFGLDIFGRYNEQSASVKKPLKVNIPAGVTKIGDYAYSGVLFDGTLSIPNGVQYIGTYAFGWEKSFNNYHTVEIPASVKGIGENAFHTSSLVRAVLAAEEYPTFSYNNNDVYDVDMFGNNYISNLEIYVPAKLIENYKTANIHVTNIVYKDITEYTPGEVMILI